MSDRDKRRRSCIVRECFANRGGVCVCLAEAFQKECPFFKTWDEVDDETKRLVKDAT